ncbi:MAG: alpha/beta hydrolase [Geodermatophilaceae bacterium]|nr:alpha/beta hydrolase [Geodermatophilaceae bacterium]
MVRRMSLVLLTVSVVVVLLLGMLALFQRRLIYLTGSGQVPPVAGVLPGASEWRLQTEDGLELAAWFVAAESPRPDGMTVLVAPGNAGNRADRAPLARALGDVGFDVLLVDYRGYGGNPGSPTETGLGLDVRAGYAALRLHDVPADRILLFGESIGAAVVTALAGDVSAAGLVLRSPFIGLATVAADAYPILPVRWLLWDDFPLLDRISEVRVPVAVVYGTADSIVDPQQSRRVAEAAPRLVGTFPVEGADHNDAALSYGPQVVAAVRAVADV